MSTSPATATESAAPEAATETEVAETQSEMYLAVSEAVDAIRPVIQMDGGDIRLVELQEDTGVVTVELGGACVGCAASSMTLKAGVERILTERVPGVTQVNALGLEIDDDDMAAYGY